MTKLMKYLRSSIVLFLISGFICEHHARAETPTDKNAPKDLKIVFLVGEKFSGFWPLAEAFAKAAADDLGIRFEVYRAADPVKMIENMKTALSNTADLPDGFLFINYKRMAGRMIALAEQAGVPALMFNAGPLEDDSFGNPRENFKNYIGLITPDDEQAGYDLARILIEDAIRKNLRGNDGKVHIVALEGRNNSDPALQRKKGLLRAVDERDDVVIDQFYLSRWKRQLAEAAYTTAHSRYMDAKVFWAASDSMMLGVLDGAKKLGEKPGVDFVVGGIDLLPSIQPLVSSGEATVSIGAHYSEAAWGIILLYDYLSGCDFTDLPFANLKTEMMIMRTGDKPLIPAENVAVFEEWARTKDFSKFSRCITNSKEPYSFQIGDFFN